MFSSLKSLAKLTFGGQKYEGENHWTEEMGTFYEQSATDAEGKEARLTEFQGKVSLVTNVACKCGYTAPSYTAMQDFYRKYHERGLEILAFPSNQFLGQEPWPEPQIKAWLADQYPDLKAHLYQKADVNGPNTQPIYTWLKSVFPGDIAWNFGSKFIIGRDGKPVARFDAKQSWEIIEAALKEELAKGAPKVSSKVASEEAKADAEEKADDETTTQEPVSSAAPSVKTQEPPETTKEVQAETTKMEKNEG